MAEEIFWQDPQWIAAVTGLFAVVLSFLGFVVQKQSVKFQIKSSIKEKWVNQFRDNLSYFLTHATKAQDFFEEYMGIVRFIQGIHLSKKDISKELLEEERKLLSGFRECTDKMYELSHKITLFLNTEDKVHSEFLGKLMAWDSFYKQWKNEVSSKNLDSSARGQYMQRGVELQIEVTDAAKKVINHELKEML